MRHYTTQGSIKRLLDIVSMSCVFDHVKSLKKPGALLTLLNSEERKALAEAKSSDFQQMPSCRYLLSMGSAADDADQYKQATQKASRKLGFRH